jgi:hypothetical protein
MDNVTPPPSKGPTVMSAKEAEESISTTAIDFEESSFVSENKFASKGDAVKPEEDEDNSDAEEYEKSFIEGKDDSSEDDVQDEDTIDKVMHELADQPFEVAMSNLEVTKDEVLFAAEQVFSKKGYFEMEFDLPFNGHITLRSKTINDYINYTEYVRRLLLDPISQKEFDAVTEARHLGYAIVELDGDDFSGYDIEDKFDMVRNMSEPKLTSILNTTKKFWRVAHVLLHPGLSDFLLKTHVES